MELLGIQLTDASPPVLHVEGEIDIASADQLASALADAVATETKVVVDLAGVTFVDAAGLRALLEAAERLNGSGPLTIVNGARVDRLLRLIGLEGLASVEIRDGSAGVHGR